MAAAARATGAEIAARALPYAAAEVAAVAAARPSWAQTVLRVRDVAKSEAFYTKHFGMARVGHEEDAAAKVQRVFLATLRDGDSSGEAVKPQSLAVGTALLVLQQRQGTEAIPADADASQLPHTDTAGRRQLYTHGNDGEKGHGFGHIAFNTADVYKASEELEAAGVAFKKRPDEGRMKGLAFCLDEDGYWVELVRRTPECKIQRQYNLSQTMIRIQDPAAEIPFFRLFGMSVLSARDFSDFSLFFLANLPEGTSEDSKPDTHDMFDPALELTWNHGTEKEGEKNPYESGNVEPNTGFRAIGFLVDDVPATVAALAKLGIDAKEKGDAEDATATAVVISPTGYHVHLFPRAK